MPFNHDCKSTMKLKTVFNFPKLQKIDIQHWVIPKHLASGKYLDIWHKESTWTSSIGENFWQPMIINQSLKVS